MSATFIVVADGKLARFFRFERAAAPGQSPELIEGAELINPDIEGARTGGPERVKTERVNSRQAGDIGPERKQHRLELVRRFGREIAQLTSKMANRQNVGTVVLIADPQLLGLMRRDVRESLNPVIELKELARDYTRLTPEELHDHLASSRLVPA